MINIIFFGRRFVSFFYFKKGFVQGYYLKFLILNPKFRLTGQVQDTLFPVVPSGQLRDSFGTCSENNGHSQRITEEETKKRRRRHEGGGIKGFEGLGHSF